MTILVSAGVDVSIIDDSMYVTGQEATVPLIILATADRKLQSDGVTPALGTFEHGVIRTVTSLRQAMELYGLPQFYSTGGLAHHGDARNEYGLDALHKYTDIANRAYVVRANINLDDRPESIRTNWTDVINEAAQNLNDLISDYIVEYNNVNGLWSPTQTGYKTTVTKDELISLLDEALAPVFALYSFSKDQFKNDFLNDHTVDHAGYQDVLFDTSGGYLQTTDITGFEEDETLYGAQVRIVHSSGTTVFDLFYEGQNVVTFGQLIDAINDTLGGDGVCELIAGRLRITSNLDGVTSEVEILTDGPSGYLPLFGSLNLFKTIAEPVAGQGIESLIVYDDDFNTVVGDYYGLYHLIDAWGSVDIHDHEINLNDNIGSVVADEFTGSEAEGLLIAAAEDFDNTVEFRDSTSLGGNDAARRAVIVAELQRTVNEVKALYADHLEYNIVVCPGYHEVNNDLVTLSQKMLEEVFVIGETPFDRPPTGARGIVNWASTASGGAVQSRDIALYYGHGLSSNFDGATIMTTAASTALRVYAYNDRERDVWWAPAGPSRGNCPHLETIGYVSGALGGPTTFVEEFLDQGTRDALYEFYKNINPITFIQGRGIMVLGQKTRQNFASAMDRVNVSRLVKYIKRQLRKALFSFLFEPNDKITRDNVKFMVDGFLSDLIDRRALYDFATICDESNNTPVRIERNELWVDAAIKPVKAVEFIYCPVRIVNTGADIGSGRNIVVGA